MTMLDEITDEKITTSSENGDHDLFAHYARKQDIEKSMFEGVDITALCGKKWRPSRDFTKFPVCGTCKEIYDGLNG
jgi:hypothetical protein